ncbi:hypothetical protein O3M35_005202 [Rhynocoris fuscipes]|uniref:Uncharacterized protein n=1 Tax=Rhynocoris fuscipes TaxID=488301 RepID=A0AAW1DJ51_9HEMI
MITFLNDKISNNMLQDPEIITKATRIIESLKIDIKTFSIMEMADILEETKIEYSDIKFLNKIYSLDQKLTFDIFYESYQFSIDNKNVTQKFENILKIILNEYLNDSKKLFDYVFFIKKFFRKINREEFIEDFMNIIRDNNSIPETIRSILFAEKLCIYNEENKILSSLKSDYGYGIKLITPKLFHNKDFWMLNNKEENTYEINNYHYEQYSLALMDDNIPEVSIENKEFAKNNLWIIEPNYDYALIKNVKNNKYLVASPNLIFTDDEYHNRIFSTKWRIKDCSDCTERSLFCDNADCIKMDNWCDGVNHCSDGSDENNCCSQNSRRLQCKNSYYNCFEKFQLCDGINDCSDRTDELYCRQ